MGIWESALILLGIGIVSERFGAGVGLGELGTGIRTLAAAPLGGIGVGLGEFSGGLRALGESLGDIGRGFGTLFENIPQFGEKGFPPRQPPAISTPSTPPLITVSGGDKTSNLTGGGGNVPNGRVLTLGVAGFGEFTGTYAQATSFFAARGLSPPQIHSLIDPQFNTMKAGNLV